MVLGSVQQTDAKQYRNY